MGEQQGVVRTNISLPRDLKGRMEAVKAQVNWSAVAAQAFEAKLLELETKNRVDSLDDVIARLKAAARLEIKENYEAGFAAGERWAKQDARPSQLRRLAAYIAGYAKQNEEWFNVYPSAFAREVFGLNDDDFDDEEFWLEVLGDDFERVENDDFFRGFGEGAAALWEKVKDKV